MIRDGEELACDLQAYLEWRLGMERTEAAAMRGQWPTTYKEHRRVQDDDQMRLISECESRAGRIRSRNHYGTLLARAVAVASDYLVLTRMRSERSTAR